MDKNTAPAPTGCYKCGRPGHWSRDCTFAPSSAPASAPAPASKPHAQAWNKPAEKPKVVKKQTRRTLTPDLLLSDQGLGYVLEHIPRMVHTKGPGHEIADLGNLMEAYVHWHKLVLPSVSFQYFVERVERVGATRRVRTCLRELRERVAKGENPKTLHEPPTEPIPADDEMVDTDVGVGEELDKDVAEDDVIEEDLFDQLYRQATGGEPAPSKNGPDCEISGQASSTLDNSHEHGTQLSGNDASGQKTQAQLSEEQRVRMESNRLRALERAAARASSQSQIQ